MRHRVTLFTLPKSRGIFAILWLAIASGSLVFAPEVSAKVHSAVDAVSCEMALQRTRRVEARFIPRIEGLRGRAQSLVTTASARSAIDRYFDRLIDPNRDDTQLRDGLRTWVGHLASAIAAFDPNSERLMSGYLRWDRQQVQEWISFSQTTLDRMRHAAEAQNLTVVEVLPLAIDYMAAITAMRATESFAWSTATSFSLDRMTVYQDGSEMYSQIKELLRAFPFVQVELTESDPTIYGFRETFIVPNFFVGVTHNLTLYDGAALSRTTGDGEAPYQFGFSHDIQNHLHKLLASFGSLLTDRTSAVHVTRPADAVSTQALLDEIERRIRFFEEFDSVATRSLDVETGQAANLFLFFIVHDLGEVHDWSRSGMEAAIERLFEPNQNSRDPLPDLVSRLTGPHDFGEDPSISDLVSLAQRDPGSAIRKIRDAIEFLRGLDW